jgi:hypothetical protein
LHFVLRKRVLRFPRVKDSGRETKLEMCSGRILRLAIHFFLEAESVSRERKAGIGVFPGIEEPIRLLCGVGFVPFGVIDARDDSSCARDLGVSKRTHFFHDVRRKTDVASPGIKGPSTSARARVSGIEVRIGALAGRRNGGKYGYEK